MLGSRAIYPTRFLPFILLLAGSKLCRSFGIFLSYDLLKLVHVVQFLFLIKAGSAILLVCLQSPFSTGKRITKNQWFRIFRHAFFGSLINLLWLFGLSLCGPLRTLLLFEHSDLAVIAGAGALFSNAGGPAKFRGAVFFLIAVMGLLLFDHDDYKPNMADHHETGHPHNSILTHIFSHITNLTGLSDHKGGVVLLFVTLCMQTGYNSAAKKLSVDIGGAKRLHALSTSMSAVILLPWAFFITATRESIVESWISLAVPMALVTIGLTADYYVEAVCVNRMEAPRTARVGSHAALVGALLLSCLWNHPFVGHLTKTHKLRALIAEEHILSGGVIFSFVLFISATQVLTSATKASKGSLVGYSAAGLPLYSFTGDTLQRTSQSVLIIIRNGLRQILEETDSRRIFYFLCVNLSFTFVELTYGAWTNSLGLISDGFHMLFDCSALVMGLYAAVMTRWKPTRQFSYGFDRVEILSGFINAIFLIVISFFVFTAGMSRLIDPPEIHTERLLTVSVAGLAVNLIGIAAFSHGHGHGGLSHGHSHGGGGGGGGHAHGGHGHSHGGDVQCHSHGGAGHTHGGGGHAHGGGGHAHGGGGGSHSHGGHNSNMQGVFLHVLADTLGSVGVIISTLLIENFGFTRADPICSLFIAILIFLSVVPLVKETSLMLLLRTPEDIQENLGISLQKVLAIDGVLSYRDEHFWRHSSKVVCGKIHIQIKPETSEQKIQAAVQAILKEEGVNNLTVQVERESFFQHLSGLGLHMNQVYEMTSHMKSLNYDMKANFIKAI